MDTSSLSKHCCSVRSFGFMYEKNNIYILLVLVYNIFSLDVKNVIQKKGGNCKQPELSYVPSLVLNAYGTYLRVSVVYSLIEVNISSASSPYIAGLSGEST